MTVALAIMAKAPRVGDVKTRLCPPLSPRQAAALARCFLRDRIAQVRGLHGVQGVIAYTPEPEIFERLAPDFTLVAQRDGDLGERMRALLAELIDTGYPAAIAVGTDTPTLPPAVLQRAVDVIASGDVDLVLGPAEDGGYYLIGVRADHPPLFAGVPWSTPAVLEITRDRAAAAGLSATLLSPWFDVDTGADLERLRADLAGDPYAAPATHRFLAGHDACRRRAAR